MEANNFEVTNRIVSNITAKVVDDIFQLDLGPVEIWAKDRSLIFALLTESYRLVRELPDNSESFTSFRERVVDILGKNHKHPQDSANIAYFKWFGSDNYNTEKYLEIEELAEIINGRKEYWN